MWKRFKDSHWKDKLFIVVVIIILAIILTIGGVTRTFKALSIFIVPTLFVLLMKWISRNDDKD